MTSPDAFFPRPTPSTLGDREVPLEGTHLWGKRVALLISGSIAAYRSPDIARALRRQGADVVAFASDEALRYVTRDVLAWSTTNPVITELTPAAEHLSDDRPFAAYVLAPATYNTLNKFRQGIADTVLTSTLASALGRSLDPHRPENRPKILVAPCMHGSLHTPILEETIGKLKSWGVHVIPPRDGYGKHNLPDPVAIAVETCRAVSPSPVRNQKILVTGGPTPVPIDNVRRLTNKFTGRLGMAIAEELFRRGADVHLIHGQGTTTPPSWLPHEVVPTYDAYRDRIHSRLAETPHGAAIFSAAVADYAPETVHPGKIPSGGALQAIALKPTEKVIAQVRKNHPQLVMVTFKYQERVTHGELLGIARDRLVQGYEAVIANRGEDVGPDGEQVAYLVTQTGVSEGLVGKPGIARAIADYLETRLPDC
ncbi:MAG: phosphopantothenoylcysteine decarboxylase [Cyanobacteria bacterium P01_H01_bin.130]